MKRKEKLLRKILLITIILIVILLIIYIINRITYSWYINKCGSVNPVYVEGEGTKEQIECEKIADSLHIREDERSYVMKPIIYLYPEKEEEITVTLGVPESITVSYPKYTDGWKVFAKPNGDLIDIKTNKKLYSLYYENNSNYDYKIEEDGFIVKGKDTIDFLEEKLSILGLNYKEREEFIVYWLPKLEKNKYNYIRFATPKEIENNMPLSFSKTPDTLIRILMTYKKLDEPIKVKEQKLTTPKRVGFTAVEWGGTEIK